jgi:uncharacterized membrane protein
MKSEIREIRKINVLSVGKVLLVLGLIMGLLQGISLGFAAKQTLLTNPDLAAMSLTDPQVAGNAQAMLGLFLIKLGYWSILVMPILLGLAYSLGAMILALIYNLISRYIGGVKLVLD